MEYEEINTKLTRDIKVLKILSLKRRGDFRF